MIIMVRRNGDSSQNVDGPHEKGLLLHDAMINILRALTGAGGATSDVNGAAKNV